MKNPVLSAWMSAANQAAGASRGLWAAEWQRQQTQLMNEWVEQYWKFWTGGLYSPAKSRKR